MAFHVVETYEHGLPIVRGSFQSGPGTGVPGNRPRCCCRGLQPLVLPGSPRRSARSTLLARQKAPSKCHAAFAILALDIAEQHAGLCPRGQRADPPSAPHATQLYIARHRSPSAATGSWWLSSMRSSLRSKRSSMWSPSDAQQSANLRCARRLLRINARATDTCASRRSEVRGWYSNADTGARLQPEPWCEQPLNLAQAWVIDSQPLQSRRRGQCYSPAFCGRLYGACPAQGTIASPITQNRVERQMTSGAPGAISLRPRSRAVRPRSATQFNPEKFEKRPVKQVLRSELIQLLDREMPELDIGTAELLSASCMSRCPDHPWRGVAGED